MGYLEQFASKLKDLGVPIWLIFLIMVLPIVVRSLGHLVGSVLTGRATAGQTEEATRQQGSIGDEWRGVVQELRELHDECLNKHRDCEKRLDEFEMEKREIQRRLDEFERRCAACTLTGRSTGMSDSPGVLGD